MKHKTFVYKVENNGCNNDDCQFTENQVIEIWADIIKPVDEPEFAEECDCKLAKIITTAPVNPQELQSAIDRAAPGYQLMTWWIPELEDEF